MKSYSFIGIISTIMMVLVSLNVVGDTTEISNNESAANNNEFDYRVILTADDGMRVHPDNQGTSYGMVVYDSQYLSGGTSLTHFWIGSDENDMEQLEIGTSGDISTYTGEGISDDSGAGVNWYSIEWYGTYDGRTLYYKQKYGSEDSSGYHWIGTEVKMTGSYQQYYIYSQVFNNINIRSTMADNVYFYDFNADSSWTEVKNEITIGDDGDRPGIADDEKIKFVASSGDNTVYAGGNLAYQKPIFTIQRKEASNPDLDHPVHDNNGVNPSGYDLILWADFRHDFYAETGSGYTSRYIYLDCDNY